MRNGVIPALLLALVCLPANVLGEAPEVAFNMNLLGIWNERQLPGSFYFYADIWGYTDTASGKEYALIAVVGEGLSIVDIDANPPVEVALVPSLMPGRDAKDVKVYKHYAILIKGQEPAQVIDLSDPTQPDSVSIIHLGPLSSNGGAHNCFVLDQYLYIVGDNGNGGLTIYDLSDPAQPDKVGEYQPYYYHDFHARGDVGYAAAIFGGGIDILDISDKSQPSLISNINYNGSGAHNSWTTEDGRYLFVGDEIGSSGNWTRIFDVSDPLNVTQVSEYIVDSLATVHNCYVQGDYLYVAHYTEGVRVVNVANPANPVEVAYYDTYPAQGYGYGGVWSVYPYFDSGKIIASDRHTGLYVLEVDWASLGTDPPTDPFPDEFSLAQNYPNPFNSATTFRYVLPRSGWVELSIYDLAGRLVATSVDASQTAGHHRTVWDAGTAVSGIYFYVLRLGDQSRTRKLLLLK